MLTNDRCDVTVVIPTRNRANFLSEALRSALSQVDISFEIRVVDDGSSDATPELLKACVDTRVKPVRHASPRGVAAARNRAAAEARGEWLAFLDDDDIWAPTWLRTGLEIARTRGAGAVYGGYWIVDEQRRVLGAELARHPSQVHRLLADYNAVGGPSSVMVRTDVMAAAGGFDERLSALADWEAWLRVFDRCQAAAVPELLSAYTVYPGNMHAQDPFGVYKEFDIFARIVSTHGGTIKAVADETFITWMATESSRMGHRSRAARFWLRGARRARRPRRVVRAALALARNRTPNGSTLAPPAWLASLADHPAFPIGVHSEAPDAQHLREAKRHSVRSQARTNTWIADTTAWIADTTATERAAAS